MPCLEKTLNEFKLCKPGQFGVKEGDVLCLNNGFKSDYENIAEATLIHHMQHLKRIAHTPIDH